MGVRKEKGYEKMFEKPNRKGPHYKYYKEGKCRFGLNCWNIHERESEQREQKDKTDKEKRKGSVVYREKKENQCEEERYKEKRHDIQRNKECYYDTRKVKKNGTNMSIDGDNS